MDRHDKTHRAVFGFKHGVGHWANWGKTMPLGSITGLLDKDGEPLVCGDIVQFHDRIGRLFLFRGNKRECGFLFNFNFAPFDEFVPESFGKGRSIPLDNGARMSIVKLGDCWQSIADINRQFS